MKDEEVRIRIGDGKTVTLKELFEGKQKTRKKMTGLPFGNSSAFAENKQFVIARRPS